MFCDVPPVIRLNPAISIRVPAVVVASSEAEIHMTVGCGCPVAAHQTVAPVWFVNSNNAGGSWMKRGPSSIDVISSLPLAQISIKQEEKKRKKMSWKHSITGQDAEKDIQHYVCVQAGIDNSMIKNITSCYLRWAAAVEAAQKRNFFDQEKTLALTAGLGCCWPCDSLREWGL